MKKIDNKTFLIIGVIIAVVIGIFAVFFASGEPDSCSHVDAHYRFYYQNNGYRLYGVPVNQGD